ncbi:hypothetical protein D9M68_849760 [compost metagenome]
MEKHSRVMELIKQKFHPEEWKAEQERKERETAELMAYVDGVVAEYNRKKLEEEKDKEDNILFKSDPSSSTGFTPTEKGRKEMKESIKKLFKR